MKLTVVVAFVAAAAAQDLPAVPPSTPPSPSFPPSPPSPSIPPSMPWSNYLHRLTSVPRVSVDNCKHVTEIARGIAVPKQPLIDSNSAPKDIVMHLRALPILNEVNCKKSYPNTMTKFHSTFVNDKHKNTPKAFSEHQPSEHQ